MAEGKSESSSSSMESLDHLPSALLATIMTNLDVASICSVASTCTAFKACASQILSFIPSFHLLEIAPSMDLLRPLLPPNPLLKSMKVNCGRLDDSAIQILLQPSLHELCMLNCDEFTGKLLSEIGGRCKDLRSLCLGSVAENRGQDIQFSDLEELLRGCHELEALNLMFDVSFSAGHNNSRVWALASEKLTSLEIGYIPSVMVAELFSPNFGFHPSPNCIQPSILPNIHKLCLSVDYITDTMQELDLSNLPNLSDNAVLLLAKSRVPILELRMRQCPLIGDTSVMALASMVVDEERWHGNSLRLLDLFNCGGITPLSFRWLKKPYFPRLRWLGVTGSVNRDIVDALARSRPFLRVSCHGEELGVEEWDNADDFYMHDYDEMDEFERWLLDGEDENADEEMVNAEDNAEAME